MSSGTPIRVYRRSIIKRQRSPWEQKRKFETKAFYSILKIYLRNKFLSPLIASNFDPLAKRRRWSCESACIVADIEHAIESCLNETQRDQFWRWFVLPRCDGAEIATLTLPETRAHAEIIRKCGSAFVKCSLFPTWRTWLKPRSERVLRRLEEAHQEEAA